MGWALVRRDHRLNKAQIPPGSIPGNSTNERPPGKGAFRKLSKWKVST
jgi:hypothetical protein